jgi:hypothetical protein
MLSVTFTITVAVGGVSAGREKETVCARGEEKFQKQSVSCQVQKQEEREKSRLEAYHVRCRNKKSERRAGSRRINVERGEEEIYKCHETHHGRKGASCLMNVCERLAWPNDDPWLRYMRSDAGQCSRVVHQAGVALPLAVIGVVWISG